MANQEVLLIEETVDEKYPQTFLNVLEEMKKVRDISNRNDIMVIILYVLALECGFVPTYCSLDDEEVTNDFHYKRMLRLTKSCAKNLNLNQNSYSFKMVLYPFPLHVCNFICTVTADDLLVNCFVRNIEEATFSMVLDPAQHIVSSSTTLLKMRLQELKVLSVEFKTQIMYPLKILILRGNNIQAKCLQDSPTEIILKIAGYLNAKSLGRFVRTCKGINEACNNYQLWKRLVDRTLKKIDLLESRGKVNRALARVKSLHRLEIERRRESL